MPVTLFIFNHSTSTLVVLPRWFTIIFGWGGRLGSGRGGEEKGRSEGGEVSIQYQSLPLSPFASYSAIKNSAGLGGEVVNGEEQELRLATGNSNILDIQIEAWCLSKGIRRGSLVDDCGSQMQRERDWDNKNTKKGAENEKTPSELVGNGDRSILLLQLHTQGQAKG
ncbi:hypothetical protein H6P81_003545 [Aristolochia fimbriata]|uniref:Uncharacterized protein n=1 Tax=Aristolochia fimbriata TaxID=158543 RepID=A0AAV7FCV8_ARIFI|nr:hypothetical protein H6P81_003545 [Aristolochia fimbriata]